MILFYLLIAIMPLENHPIWQKLLADVTVTKYLGLVCLLVAFVHLAQRHSVPHYFATAQFRWFLLFIALVSVNFVIKGADFEIQNSFLISYVSFLILMVITITIVDTLPRLYWCLATAAASVAWASLYSIREWVYGYHTWGAAFRPGWVVGDANYFGVNVVLCLPINFVLFIYAKKRWQRVFFLGCLPLTLLATTLGASRGGFLGLLVAFFYLVLHTTRKARNIGVMLALLLPLLMFSPNSPVRRMFRSTYSDDQAARSRLVTWNIGLKMVAANPFLGVGLGRYKQVGPTYDSTGAFAIKPHIAHNAYLEIASEMGLPALLVFLMVIATTFHTLKKVRRRALAVGAEPLANWTLGIESGLIGAVVALFFVSGQYQKMFWLMISFSMCMPALVPKWSAAKREPPTQEQVNEEPGLQVGTALVEMR